MKKSIVFLIHISLWAVIYITTYTVLHTFLKNPFPSVGYNPFWTYGWITIEIIVGVLIPFYTFYYLLPKLIRKKNRLIWYFIALLFLILYPFIALRTSDDIKTIDASNYLSSFLFYMFFAIIGGLFKVFLKWIEQGKIKDNIEKQNLKSELALLKYQINPHFLFNSLIQEDSQKASLVLNKLSELMRYMIYDSEYEQH